MARRLLSAKAPTFKHPCTFNPNVPAFTPLENGAPVFNPNAPEFNPTPPSIDVQSKPRVPNDPRFTDLSKLKSQMKSCDQCDLKSFVFEILTTLGKIDPTNKEILGIFEKHFYFFEKAFTTQERNPIKNLENLEARGDVFYNAIVVSWMNKKFPAFEQFPSEGKSISSRLRIFLVSKPVCAMISDKLFLRKFIIANDEEMMIPRDRDTIEDVFEAFLGAIVACCESEDRDDLILPILKSILYPFLDQVNKEFNDGANSSGLTYEMLYDPVTVLKELIEKFYNSGKCIIPFSFVEVTPNKYCFYICRGGTYAIRGADGKPNFTRVIGGKSEIIAEATDNFSDVAKKKCALLAIQRLAEMTDILVNPRGERMIVRPCGAFLRFKEAEKGIFPETHAWSVDTLASYLANRGMTDMSATSFRITSSNAPPNHMTAFSYFCFHKNASGVKACVDSMDSAELEKVSSVLDSRGRNWLDLLFINSFNCEELKKTEDKTSKYYEKYMQYLQISEILKMMKEQKIAFPKINAKIFEIYIKNHTVFGKKLEKYGLVCEEKSEEKSETVQNEE
jgi:dsRNA-specific ribonuclease